MNGRVWTYSEDHFLCTKYHLYTLEEVANKLNRSKQSVGIRVTKLRKAGLKIFRAKMPGKIIRVAPSKSTLSKLAEDHSLTEIAKKLNISRNTVAYWIKKYKIKFRRSLRQWTDQEIEILEAKFGNLTLEELSVMLKRTKHAISRQAHLLEKAGVQIAKRAASPEINRGIKITRTELLELLQEKELKDIAADWAVTPSAIVYWVKKYDIDLSKLKDKSKLDSSRAKYNVGKKGQKKRTSANNL